MPAAGQGEARTYHIHGPGMRVPTAGQGEAGTYHTHSPGMWVPAAGQGEAGDLPYPRSRNSLRNEALQGDQGRVLFSWT